MGGVLFSIRKESVSLQDYQAKRLGKFRYVGSCALCVPIHFCVSGCVCSEDECVISLSEFKVLKYTPRHPVRPHPLPL